MPDYRYGKPETKKATNIKIDPKYIERPEDPNIMISEDPATIQYLLERQENQKRAEQQAKLEAKRYQEEQRRMREYEQQQRERREREREEAKDFPERQFNMLLSGRYPRRNYGT